jgi:hypothetical protein
MKEFLFLFRGGDARDANQSPEAMQQHMQKWMAWMQQLAEQGKLNGGQPLTMDGKVVAGKGRKITDGPYAEGKELVGGYLLVKADDYNEAVKLSEGCPIFEYDGTVEVREIQQMTM